MQASGCRSPPWAPSPWSERGQDRLVRWWHRPKGVSAALQIERSRGQQHLRSKGQKRSHWIGVSYRQNPGETFTGKTMATIGAFLSKRSQPQWCMLRNIASSFITLRFEHTWALVARNSTSANEPRMAKRQDRNAILAGKSWERRSKERVEL